jgi:hypothetical protein
MDDKRQHLKKISHKNQKAQRPKRSVRFFFVWQSKYTFRNIKTERRRKESSGDGSFVWRILVIILLAAVTAVA